MPRKPKRSNSTAITLLVVLIVMMIAATIMLIRSCINLVNKVASPSETKTSITSGERNPERTDTAETEPLEKPQIVSTATVGATGDLLMHLNNIAVCAQSDGSYDFESIFRYAKDTMSSYDYMVANLETTFGGPDYPYRGNPFNCPDSLTESAADAGIDMLLTANNHSSDTLTDGILRTIETVRAQGLETLGTQLNDTEDKYSVVEVNGIKIGMLCYTYADGEAEAGRPVLNWNSPVSRAGIVNYFLENDLNRFCSEVETHLASMKADGAEATMLYIHWGTEYELAENATQRTIAQNMCDLGIDVIVGGHPHVVQPMDLLTSTTDPDHKTVCIYSLGNAVSNQRLGNLSNVDTAHTEDGVIFTVTFEKYSDGSVYVSGTDVVPTWVNYSTVNGKEEYNILPLDAEKREQWKEMFNLTDTLLTSAQNSYSRTTTIVNAGLQECQTWLEEAKAARDAA